MTRYDEQVCFAPPKCGSLSISIFTNVVIARCLFGIRLCAGQIMIKLGHTHHLSVAVCRVFARWHMFEPEQGMKMPLFDL